MHEARLKWYDLGLELDISDVELDVIAKKFNSDPDVCLREMLKVWLRFVNNPPTWKMIANALTSKVVDELALAKKGKSQH